jgi:hypothetical protein
LEVAMFARVASFEGGNVEELRRMNEERRAGGGTGMPEGIRRLMILNDQDTNRRLFVALFDTREELDAAQAGFESMGDEVPEDVRGRRTSVDVYEVLYEGEP